MLSALVGHLVGDYLLQNDWMALNKKRQVWPCVVHCLIWTICVCLFSGWGTRAWLSCVQLAADPSLTGLATHWNWTHWIVPGLLFGTHFIQDHTSIIRQYMTLIGQEAFATGACAPWSIIVVDNVWHILTLWLIWSYLLPNL